MRVYAHKTQHWKMLDLDSLYPVGHLSLLGSDKDLKVAKFHDVRTER